MSSVNQNFSNRSVFYNIKPKRFKNQSKNVVATYPIARISPHVSPHSSPHMKSINNSSLSVNPRFGMNYSQYQQPGAFSQNQAFQYVPNFNPSNTTGISPRGRLGKGRGRGRGRGRGSRGRYVNSYLSRPSPYSLRSSSHGKTSVHYPEDAPATPPHNPSWPDSPVDANKSDTDDLNYIVSEYGSMSKIVMPNTLKLLRQASSRKIDPNGEFSPYAIPIKGDLESVPNLSMDLPLNKTTDSTKLEKLEVENERLKLLLQQHNIPF